MKELFVGFNQRGGPGGCFLGTDYGDSGVFGKVVAERNHFVDQHWGKRFHSLHRNTLGDFRKHRRKVWELVLHLSSLGGNRRRDDYLASGENLKFGNDFCFQRTLIGNRERTNLFEFVAEKFKTHSMFGGGWENVEDSSPGGKLTSTSDHVNSLIGKFNQFEVEFWK